MGNRTTSWIFYIILISRAPRTKEKRLCSLKMPFALNACSAVENQSCKFDFQKGGRETLAEWMKRVGYCFGKGKFD